MRVWYGGRQGPILCLHLYLHLQYFAIYPLQALRHRNNVFFNKIIRYTVLGRNRIIAVQLIDIMLLF